MTGTTRSSEGLDARRRKLLFRSWHRGMREMDLILGSFADARIDALTEAELDQYEMLLDTPDTVLLPWITGEQPVPDTRQKEILKKIVAFRLAMTF
ncbi:succinate dehydrogenase assembly factor 2 [Mesorhizobium sp. LHD-90]|uniref:FAD assembly factor SdhE n=1 Tax=Mesorhizobium sp. LHD-90 TaxID=3071414 RepID=UPI0027E08203|nr:succinate dehydrogenase assembly factor 2 [Mesorhizobium sp. LHD-90]MDQ6434533.1 succinate dehydrogenase assembly factor 2 [Mesorhizobium sp. LHD-90]